MNDSPKGRAKNFKENLVSNLQSTISALTNEFAQNVARAVMKSFSELDPFVGAGAVAVLLAEGIGRSIAVLAMVVSTILLEAARRAVTGTRTTEFGHGRATGYAVVFAILSLATLAAGWYFVIELGVTWVAWVAGAVVCVLLVASGWVFERTLSSSMRR